MSNINVQELNSDNFNTTINNKDTPTIVDFWAPWCGPCRMISPIIDGLAETLGDKAVIGKVNVDDNQPIALEYNIRSLPTILIFKGGKIVKTMNGIRSRKEFEDVIISTIDNLK